MYTDYIWRKTCRIVDFGIWSCLRYKTDNLDL